MMHLNEARNVNDALEKGLQLLKMFGREEDSRNGPVITLSGPLVTTYDRPWERVLFSAARDANPFFHLYEALWMIAGQNDVRSVAHYAKRMADYSDDGEVLHGAYGFRWREWFGFDQLHEIIKHLLEQPNSRRAVLGMWSPSGDLVASEGYGGIGSKDVPCNTHVYFRARSGKLTMTVACRSNDMVYGAYGANAVHFSMLQEYVASAVGMPVGAMYQLSNDFHIYKSLPQFAALWSGGVVKNPYEHQAAVPLILPDETAFMFHEDCLRLVGEHPGTTDRTQFFRGVVNPMISAHAAWRAGADWRAELGRMPTCDWCAAGRAWLERRAA